MYQILCTKLSFHKQNLKEGKNTKIYCRLQSVYLTHKGKDNKEIIEILEVNKNSVTDWIKIYCEKGIDELCKPIEYNRRSAKIDNYIGKIKQDIKDNTISTIAELQDWIKKKYSLKIEQSWLFRCCKKTQFVLQENAVNSGKEIGQEGSERIR